MIFANFNDTGDYSAFKAAFDALGGNKRSTVFYDRSGGATLNIWALASADAGLRYSQALGPDPSTFLSDFPQAIACSSGGFI